LPVSPFVSEQITASDLTAEGVVIAVQRNCWLVRLQNGLEIRLSGRMLRNHIKVMVGDQVQVELSAYDLARGRIVYRRATPAA
jgi:translation initiation factor IF-1